MSRADLMGIFWLVVNGAIWFYAGWSFGQSRARRKRAAARMTPIERMAHDASVELDRKIRRAAFRHPFWGRAKRQAFVDRAVKEAFLAASGYALDQPCPARCVNRYVEAYDEESGFVKQVPCPLCRMAEEIYGAVTTA